MLRALAIAVFLAASLLASGGRAAALTLGDLFAGASLVDGAVVYGDWQLLSPAASGLLDITVSADPGAGLRFDAGSLLAVGGVSRLDLEFGYRVHDGSGAGLVGAGLVLDDYAASGDGYLLVDQLVFGGPSAASPVLGANVTLADGQLGMSRSRDDLAFAALPDAYSVTRIRLAGTAPGDLIALRSWSQSWLTSAPATPTPEPGAELLFGLNALLAGLALRRRSCRPTDSRPAA